MNPSERAATLLADEWFRSEVETLERELYQRIAHSEPHHIDEREQAYQQLRAMHSLLAHFEAIAATDTIRRKRWKIL